MPISIRATVRDVLPFIGRKEHILLMLSHSSSLEVGDRSRRQPAARASLPFTSWPVLDNGRVVGALASQLVGSAELPFQLLEMAKFIRRRYEKLIKYLPFGSHERTLKVFDRNVRTVSGVYGSLNFIGEVDVDYVYATDKSFTVVTTHTVPADGITYYFRYVAYLTGSSKTWMLVLQLHPKPMDAGCSATMAPL